MLDNSCKQLRAEEFLPQIAVTVHKERCIHAGYPQTPEFQLQLFVTVKHFKAEAFFKVK